MITENFLTGIIGTFRDLFGDLMPLLILIFGIFLGVFLFEQIINIFMGRLAKKRLIKEYPVIKEKYEIAKVEFEEIRKEYLAMRREISRIEREKLREEAEEYVKKYHKLPKWY